VLESNGGEAGKGGNGLEYPTACPCNWSMPPTVHMMFCTYSDQYIKDTRTHGMEARKFRLFISPDLRSAMRRLIALFQSDMWDMRLTNTTNGAAQFNETQIPALVRALYSNVDGKGTQATLDIMRDACTPTDWLVKFLTSRKAVVKDSRVLDFVQTVLDEVNTIYGLIGPVHTHYRWEPTHNACVSSLLVQLKSTVS
jgi:hypothetical protein